jgi:hypothetical protein
MAKFLTVQAVQKKQLSGEHASWASGQSCGEGDFRRSQESAKIIK